VEDRRALLAEAMRLAAPRLDPPITPTPTPPAAGADAGFDERLAAPGIENEPLYLLMAGIHAARHGAPTALALDQGELAFEMAGIEQARLSRFATLRGFGDGGALLRHLAVCVTLQSDCRLEALPSLIREESAQLGAAAPFGPEAIAEQLCDYLGGEDGWANGVRPALIGEAFVLDALKADRFRPAASQLAIVMRAYRRDPDGVVVTLIRCAQDHADGRLDHPAVQWLGAIVAESNDIAELVRISDLLPDETMALGELAVRTYQRLQSLLVAGLESDPAALAPALARCLNNLATRLSRLGEREAALDAIQNAVTLYRGLADDDPDTFTPTLAGALLNLASRLEAVGRLGSALDAADESCRLHRVLAADRPDGFTANLAASLSNKATLLAGLGWPRDALTDAQEAVAHFRKLSAERPHDFAPALSIAVGNLANWLGETGQTEAALEATREAVDLDRALAAESPDAFMPGLAMSLHNLGGRLAQLGQLDAALDAAEEAVEKSRTLADEHPDAFTSDLAMSLIGLASRLAALEQPEAALKAAVEAVELYGALADERPGAFRPDLAGSLVQLAGILQQLGQQEAALEKVQAAARIFTELTAERAGVYAPKLTMTLATVAYLLEATGHLAEALAKDEEAIAAIAPCFLANPRAHAELVATCVGEYGRRAEAAGAEPRGDLVDPILEAFERLGAPTEPP
jgi:tetratricopeptide (TPR) repeat protein